MRQYALVGIFWSNQQPLICSWEMAKAAARAYNFHIHNAEWFAGSGVVTFIGLFTADGVKLVVHVCEDFVRHYQEELTVCYLVCTEAITVFPHFPPSLPRKL